MDKRTWVGIAVLMVLAVLACWSCSGRSSPKPVRVVVLLFGNHPTLRSVADNVQVGLLEAGVKDAQVAIRDANFDKTEAVAQAKAAFAERPTAIVALGTPAIVAAIQNRTGSTPLFFGATNDPVALGLTASRDPTSWRSPDAFRKLEYTHGLVSDFDFERIAALAQAAMLYRSPASINTVGMVANSEEPNARLAADLLRERLSTKQIDLAIATVARPEECAAAAQTLLARHVGLIQVGPDNVAASGVSSIVKVADGKGLLVLAFDRASVAAGAAAACGVDFAQLGRQLGRDSAAMLGSAETLGAAGGSPAIRLFSDTKLYINTKAIKAALNPNDCEAFLRQARELGLAVELVGE
ncbi:MAG: ABC transporter substrate-binding protein [Phycisphaerales bacterium]